VNERDFAEAIPASKRCGHPSSVAYDLDLSVGDYVELVSIISLVDYVDSRWESERFESPRE
jgi:hypothetical protein